MRILDFGRVIELDQHDMKALKKNGVVTFGKQIVRTVHIVATPEKEERAGSYWDIEPGAGL